MRSSRPKVLHELAGRTMVGHVCAAARELSPARLLVVVGHGREQVVEHLAEVHPPGAHPAAEPVVQEQQRGTGNAVRVALQAAGVDEGTVVVVPGDAPLLRGETLAALLAEHARTSAACTLLTAVLDDPTGYGRVLRGATGAVSAVVEQRDATDEQRAVREVAVSVYAFDAAALSGALARVGTDNSSGEEYLTDVVGLLVGDGAGVAAVAAADPGETAGVNDRVQLAAAREEMRDRLVDAALRAGADVRDRAGTWLDADVVLEPDCSVLPGTSLQGRTRVATGAVVGPHATLRDVEVGEGAVVTTSTVVGAVLAAGAVVGPYAYVRPGTHVGPGARLGAFVEAKEAVLGEGAKVPHLSYVGDAEIGAHSNIGAATVFVNYDGVAKHRTVVGAHVRVGSDTMLVAPLSVGDGAYTAAGSVITDDVPAGAMAVARGRQRTIEGWTERRRPGTAAARAAAAAGDGVSGRPHEAGEQP